LHRDAWAALHAGGSDPGAMIPAPETHVSLWAPHPQMSVRRKPGQPGECGRQVWREAVAGGLRSGSRSLAEAGPDGPSVPDRLVAPAQRLGRPPQWLAADRGGSSAATAAKAPPARGRRLVMPYAGKAPPARVAQERTTGFRRELRWRAGMEGRSRVLSRRFGVDRCRDQGAAGLGRWVGWGRVTANLLTRARTGASRSARGVCRAA
jgi:hypothetical protein